MAGGNRYKHRSLGGGLVPNNQQAPSNNFYVAPPPEPSMLEKALQLAQALGDASSEFTGKANANPANQLSPFGAAPTQFIKDSAKYLWDEKFGLVPAKKAWDSGTTLADILSGKEQSTPFAPAQGTQLAGDTANNAAIAALDASTLIPGLGVVPKGTYKAAGNLVGDASSVVAKGVRKLGYEPIPNQNALGVFGGPLAKTADHKALDLAKSLEKAGKPREEIWSQTGWFKGVDGKWRFEIDDSAFQPKSDAMFRKDGVMSDFFDDADSGGAYPELADSPTVRMKKSSLFNPKTGAIGFTGRGQKGRSGALHERQHAIQEKEGFASGGSPDFSHKFDDVETWKVYEANQQELRDILDSVDVWGLKKRQKNIEDLARGVYPESMTARLSKEDYFRPPSDNELPFLQRFDELAAAQKEIQSRNRMLDPVEGYARLAGEVEARNVQKRMNLTPDQRRAAPPWTTQDVPDEKQFVLFDRMNPNAGFPFSGKDGEKPLLSALMDAVRGHAAPSKTIPIDIGGANTTLRIGSGSKPEVSWFGSERVKNPSFSETRKAINNISAAVKKDAAETGRSGYKFTYTTDTHRRIYEQLMKDAESFGFTPGRRLNHRDGTVELTLERIKNTSLSPQKTPLPLDQFAPPKSLDDIFTGGAPRGPRELTGGSQNPAGLDGSAFNLNTPEVPYDPAKGFGGLDAKFAADKNAKTLSEALAKRAKPPGYDDWSPEWRAAYDKGLPMDTASRMARAREQGYNVDEPSFHATRTDFNEMQPGSGGQLGPGVYFAKDPETTVDYAVKGARDPADAVNWIKRNKGQPVPPELMYDFDGGRTMKLATRGNLAGEDQYQKIFSRYANVDKLPRAQAEARAVEDLRAMGYDGVSSPFLDHHSIFDPANIRSTSAAFDPANAGKPTLLGMGAPFEGKPKGMDPFWDDRLGPSLNKAVEMKRNGYSHAEIEDEMGLAPGTAAAYLARARSTLGVDTVPKTVGVKPNATQDTILSLYQKGLSNAQIAERASVIHGRTISPNTVKVQISQAKSKGLIEPIKRQTNMGAPADDLIKLLMAYGAFGGMSAGALATMDAQKHQQGGM